MTPGQALGMLFVGVVALSIRRSHSLFDIKKSISRDT